MQAGSVEEVVTWMEHEAGTAFCLLPSTANADLLFVVKLADESFVWVVLKALATDQPLHASDLKDKFAVLQANSFLGNIDDTIQSRLDAALDSLPKTGRCKLLRAVSSFPVEITVLDESVNSKVRDVAVVSIAALESKAYQVKQTDFFDAIVAGVLAGHKRKSPWEPKDGKLYTSSKRLKRDSDWERPRASWDGPVEGVDDDDTDEETTTSSSSPSPPPPPPKRKPRPQAKSNPPVQAIKGKGKGKGRGVPVALPATRKRKRISDPKPSAPAVGSSSKRPRTPAQPPRKQHEATQKRGWKGWVEGSPPPPANLIDLDSVPVLPGRRTRSGKNFDALSGKEG
ncbi:hypothetical protein HMN09_01066800 [Mycena chlorophos]|uniref:Uncharacterized protein n=1 Tax=Mycena chlorophos TaxID=658473 RepID=A0A8H6SBX5_MYCCL|nr:hypothetical protein HMN09_01066800 [Mycena chlorophos]